MRIAYEKGSYTLSLSFSKIIIDVNLIGDDVLIAVHGGDKPHIGGTVLSVPRPSLKNDGGAGVTSSVINITGHKDEAILRMLAERAALKWNVNVVCIGGFHMDHISQADIQEVLSACEGIEFV